MSDQHTNAEELAKLAAPLLERIPSDAPLALLAPNGKAALVGRLIANRLALPLVPINPLLSAKEVEYIVADSQARILLCAPALRPLAESAARKGGPRLLEISTASLGPDQALVYKGRAGHAPFTDASIGATLIYTSGTTGRPKGCLRSAEQEAARVRELIQSYELGPGDTQLIASPLGHSAPGIFLRAAHAIGATTVILPRFEAHRFWRRWQRHQASFFFLVPTQYQRLVAAFSDERVPACLRRAIVAGSPLRPPLHKKLSTWLGPGKLFQFFGSSETGTISIAPPQMGIEQGVGRPAPGVQIEIRKPDGSCCATGEQGEIFVRSPTLMSGYWPEVQREPFISVGDLGFQDERGNLHLVDRKADTIISGGVNVHPAQVESALLLHDSVAAAVVVGIEDEHWGEKIVALVARKPSHALTPEALIGHCKQVLVPYKAPKEVHWATLEEMPIGASGKPLRRVARAIILNRP